MLKDKLGLDAIRLVGDPEKMVKKVGLCTGAGVSFTALAAAKGCDAYLTGDIKYHEAQEAIEKGIGVVDVTHYASEVLIVPVLQKKLTEAATNRQNCSACHCDRRQPARRYCCH